MTTGDATDWDEVRAGAWENVKVYLELSSQKLDALRFALYADSKCLLRDHSLKERLPDVDGALPEPTAVDGYLDALTDACAWLSNNSLGATGKLLLEALRPRAEGAPKRATNRAIDALHDASVRMEQLTEEARKKALEEVAALLRARADERWARGNKVEATELHFVASEVEKLTKEVT